MIVGTTLFRLSGAAYHSPEFSRGGLAATFVVNLTQYSVEGATGFKITVETRNSEDTTWTSLGSFALATTTGVLTVDFASIREIVRFKYEFSGAGAASSDAVHFLMMAPSWRPY
jgi:hypothetical protein